MRNLIFLLVALFISGAAMAQKSAIQSGSNYIRYGQLDKAKTALDGAVKHEKTLSVSKAWKLRGDVYLLLHFANTKNEKYEDLHKYAGIADNPLVSAAESFNKAIEFGKGDEYAEDSKKGLTDVSNYMFNDGVVQFQAKTFDKALVTFEQVIGLNPENKAAVLNAAYAANRIDNKDKTVEYLEILVKDEYDEPNIYLMLAQTHQQKGNEERASEVLTKGRLNYPDNQKLLKADINQHLKEGKKQEAIELLDLAIDNDPENAQLLYTKGNMYQQLGDLEKAVAGYEQALQMDPKYFDAVYSIGALYFNKGADLANAANKLPMGKEYESAKKEFEGFFNKAKPFLEQALELKADDMDTLKSLKQLYARTSETEKYNMVSEKLKGLQ